MYLSIIIPAHNEEKHIEKTVSRFNKELIKHNVRHEIIVVNDHSTDNSLYFLSRLSKDIEEVTFIDNDSAKGFGNAIKKGLTFFNGDYVAIVMADMSEDPSDLINYIRKVEEGYDCVFGSRFIKGGRVFRYPFFKLIFNRLGNYLIMVLFRIKLNDTTNAFKLYSKEIFKNIGPLVSNSFDITVELPLKSISNGYSYAIIPISWRNNRKDKSRFNIIKSFPHYTKTIINCFFYDKNKKIEFKEFLKYFITGILGFFLDIGTLFILKDYLGFSAVSSVAINQIITTAYIFSLNKYWVFKIKRELGRQIIKFYLISFFNYSFAIIWMWFFHGVLNQNYILVRILNIALSVSWNFLLYKFFVYRR